MEILFPRCNGNQHRHQLLWELDLHGEITLPKTHYSTKKTTTIVKFGASNLRALIKIFGH